MKIDYTVLHNRLSFGTKERNFHERSVVKIHTLFIFTKICYHISIFIRMYKIQTLYTTTYLYLWHLAIVNRYNWDRLSSLSLKGWNLKNTWQCKLNDQALSTVNLPFRSIWMFTRHRSFLLQPFAQTPWNFLFKLCACGNSHFSKQIFYVFLKLFNNLKSRETKKAQVPELSIFADIFYLKIFSPSKVPKVN